MQTDSHNFDEIWILKHGAPSSVRVDPEWDRDPFKKFIEYHSIKWESSPEGTINSLSLSARFA